MKNTITQLPEELENLIDIIDKKYITMTGLFYGWKSVDENYDSGHWNRVVLKNSTYYPYDHGEMPYIKNHPEIELLWNILKLNLGNKKLLRLYINAYTYGTDAYSHQDDMWLEKKFGLEGVGQTIIVYLNKTWDKDWAGETVVFNDEDEIEFSVLPKYMRVLCFDAHKFHAARPLSRICHDLRKVLVFKTLGDCANSSVIEFLLSITKNSIHNNKTFFEHLYNTMNILEHKKESKDVISAGLFHSIYGTEYYNFVNDTISRDKIKSMIGDYAESLVYEFCTIKNRTNSLINNTNNYDIKFRNDLLKIELANLEEQNIQEKYNQQIKQINECLNHDT